jgi:hypothetical protein
LPLVLAYHGCDLETAQKLLGGSSFQPSNRDYDWLGAGIYFWENDVIRAYQWATETRGNFDHPSVVGTVIELGACLELTIQAGIDAVKLAHRQFITMAGRKGVPIPENIDSTKPTSRDRIIRRLDCAVMNYLYGIRETEKELDLMSPSYATVRALFPEGSELYPGAGFWDKTHIQICVREPEQILGVFRIPEWQRMELELPSLYESS